MSLALGITLAALALGGAVEWWLLRRGVPAYFRWGLLCYAAQVYPEDTGDPDEDDAPELARRSSRLRALLKERWERADPRRRWEARETGPGRFALRPLFPNPLLLRAQVEVVDGGVALQAFVPWTFIGFPVLLVLGAELVPGEVIVGAIIAVLVAGVFFLRELDRLLYRGMEPLLGRG